MFLVRSLELAGSICILAGKEGYSDLDFFLVILYNRLQQRRKVACYVVAVENGVLRQLTDKEEAEFQYANYGIEPERRKAEAVVPMIPSKVLLN
jgi:hypothetical protein